MVEPRRGFAAVLFAFAFLAAACAREAPPPAGPVAFFPAPKHDFGTVVQGTRLEHAFAVENRGGAELRLVRVEPAAGIAVLGYDRAVPPGGRGTVRLAFDTADLQGAGTIGVRVQTNDPQRPRVLLAFNGSVVRELAFEPRDRLYFFTVRGEAGYGQTTLVNHGTSPVTAAEAVSDSPRFRPRLEPLPGGRRWAVTVALDPATPAGHHAGTVTVRTDHPRFPAVALPVRAVIEEVVSARPAAVRFGLIRAADLDDPAVARRQVLVQRHRRGGGFRVIAARSDLPFVAVELAPQRAGESYLVTLRLVPARVRKGPLRGTLSVRTNDPEFPRLEVPIEGTVL